MKYLGIFFMTTGLFLIFSGFFSFLMIAPYWLSAMVGGGIISLLAEHLQKKAVRRKIEKDTEKKLKEILGK